MPNSPPQQTPEETFAERSAEELPALTAAAQAVGLAHHRKLLSDATARVRDSHRAMMAAAGYQDVSAQPGDDDMGNIIITGDINVQRPEDAKVLPWSGQSGQSPEPPSKPADASQPSSGSTHAPAAPNAPAGLLRRLAPYLITAAIAGGTGGAGLPLARWLLRSSAPATQPVGPTNTVRGFLLDLLE